MGLSGGLLRIAEIRYVPIVGLASRAASLGPRYVCGSDHLSITLADRTERIAYRLSVWTSLIFVSVVLNGIGPRLKLSNQRFNLGLLLSISVLASARANLASASDE
jgi:hypothetical protein